MSEMHTLKVDFTNEECLVNALKECGYKVEVHQEEVEIIPFYKGRESQKAHVVIRKNNFHGFSDAGFQRQKDGSYKLHCDEMDWNGQRGKFNVNKITQRYGLAKIKKLIRGSSKYSLLKEEEVDGELNIKLKIREFE